jgi:hypothetical protein
MADLIAQHEGMTHEVENIETKAAPHYSAAPQPATPQVLHACAPAIRLLCDAQRCVGFRLPLRANGAVKGPSRCNRSAAIGLFMSVQPPQPQSQPQPLGESSAEVILRKAKDMVAAKKLAETEVDAKRKAHEHKDKHKSRDKDKDKDKDKGRDRDRDRDKGRDRDRDRDKGVHDRRAEREHESKQSLSSLADDSSLKSVADDLSQASRMAHSPRMWSLRSDTLDSSLCRDPPSCADAKYVPLWFCERMGRR